MLMSRSKASVSFRSLLFAAAWHQGLDLAGPLRTAAVFLEKTAPTCRDSLISWMVVML